MEFLIYKFNQHILKTFSKVIFFGKTIRLRYSSRRRKGQTMNEALTTRLYLLQNTRKKSHSNLTEI